MNIIYTVEIILYKNEEKLNSWSDDDVYTDNLNG